MIDGSRYGTCLLLQDNVYNFLLPTLLSFNSRVERRLVSFAQTRKDTSKIERPDDKLHQMIITRRVQ